MALLFLAPHPSQAATNDAFARGVELSRSGQFPEAAAEFEKSAQANPAVGTYINLGLAEWQRGRAGAAIRAWEQALWINPYDARAAANLQFARDVAQVDPPQLKWHETVSALLPPNAWVWLAGITFWAAIGLLILPGVFRFRKAGWQQWLAALSFGVFLVSMTGNYGTVSRTHIGFVLRKNAPVLLTPTQNGEVVLTLNAGEPARQIRTRDNYVFVRTLGTSGWIDQSAFGLICPK